jgi:hypothetical protein
VLEAKKNIMLNSNFIFLNLKGAKDVNTKKRLKRAHDYIKYKCDLSKEKTKRLNVKR